MQQDAHEFFNYLLNAISEVLVEEKKKEQQVGNSKEHNNILAKRSVGNAAANQPEPIARHVGGLWLSK